MGIGESSSAGLQLGGDPTREVEHQSAFVLAHAVRVLNGERVVRRDIRVLEATIAAEREVARRGGRDREVAALGSPLTDDRVGAVDHAGGAVAIREDDPAGCPVLLRY